MTVMNDGSQAKKTGKDKELVLIRTLKNGIPVYYMVGLLDMQEFGGTGAEAVFNGMNSVFSDSGNIPITEEEYKLKLVSATSDGAAVNFGRKTGLMVRLQETRPWLVAIHCTNHRAELSMKDALASSPFDVADRTYVSLYSQMQSSGKLKGEIEIACEALNIKHYVFSRLTGTRFVGHRRAAYKKLLNLLPALIQAFTNVESDTKSTRDAKANAKQFCEKFTNFHFVSKIACYLDILEITTPLSKVMESRLTLPTQMKSLLDTLFATIDELVKNDDVEEELLDSHLRRYTRNDDGVLVSSYHQHGDKMNTKPQITVELSDMDIRTHDDARRQKHVILTDLQQSMQQRFEDFRQPIFDDMTWIDPAEWDRNNKHYGVPEITRCAERFALPLQHAGFNFDAAIREWRSLKKFVTLQHCGKDAEHVLRIVFQMKRNDFPNMAKLAELIHTISISNSETERTFSLLTLLLTRRRLAMAHSTLESLMIVNHNARNWTDEEKDKILDRATGIFCAKLRRTTTVTSSSSSDSTSSSAKRVRLDFGEAPVELSDDDEETDDDVDFSVEDDVFA